MHLPANSLDKLIIGLGGPDKVAEMTGRHNHTVCDNYDSDDYDSDDYNRADYNNDDSDETNATASKNTYTIQKRTAEDNKTINIDERNRFMNCEKRIAIISDVASSGISLQAHKDCLNQAKRLHITLELPWSSDKAVQQFGRTHRSNQVCAPDYLFLISKFAGEKRFASSVAKRIESMNAVMIF